MLCRPDAGRFGHSLRERLETESEIEFPPSAFCQDEGFPDGFFKVRLRDGNLQIHGFNCRAVRGCVLGFVGSVFCIHGIVFFLRLGFWFCKRGKCYEISLFRPWGVHPIGQLKEPDIEATARKKNRQAGFPFGSQYLTIKALAGWR